MSLIRFATLASLVFVILSNRAVAQSINFVDQAGSPFITSNQPTPDGFHEANSNKLFGNSGGLFGFAPNSLEQKRCEDDVKKQINGIISEREALKDFANKQTPGRRSDVVNRLLSDKQNSRELLNDREFIESYNRAKLWQVPKQENQLAGQIGPIKPDSCAIQQPKSLRRTFSFNPTDETNALKSPTRIETDRTRAFAADVLYTDGVPPSNLPGDRSRAFDLFAVDVAATSARYNTFATKNLDTTSQQVYYQQFLGATGYDVATGRYDVDVKPGPDKFRKIYPQQNLITFTVVGYGFQNQVLFAPTFHRETVDLLTPQVFLAVTNFPLSLINPVCTNSKGALGFCSFVDFAAGIGHTSSDLTTQENLTTNVSLSPGWRLCDGKTAMPTSVCDLKITLPISVTTHDYDHVIGREDRLFQVGPTISWQTPAEPPKPDTASQPFDPFAFKPVYSLSFSATYNDNYSTLGTAHWHGWVFQPKATVSF